LCGLRLKLDATHFVFFIGFHTGSCSLFRVFSIARFLLATYNQNVSGVCL